MDTASRVEETNKKARRAEYSDRVLRPGHKIGYKAEQQKTQWQAKRRERQREEPEIKERHSLGLHQLGVGTKSVSSQPSP